MKNIYKVNEEVVKKIAERVYDNGSTVINRNDLEEMFPELKESEDERIREGLIRCVKGNMPDNDFRKKYIAWLEKQGEKEADPIYKYLKELLASDNIYQMAMNDDMVQEAKTKAINALSELEIGKLLGIEKQGEQKSSAWSEEDDNCLSTIIAEFSKCAGKSVSKDKWMRCNDFLNSLKNKVQPKGYFQIEALESATENCAYSEYKDSLKELIKQLKNLN